MKRLRRRDTMHPTTLALLISASVINGKLDGEIADMVSNPEGCGGLDEWLSADMIRALDTMDPEARRVAIDGLHFLATA